MAAGGARTAVLRYDPLGRLYEITGASATTRFLYDGDALVAEYDGAGVLTARYVHGSNAGADDPLLWYGGGAAHWLHADHQGSIVGVTNGPGAIQTINAYDEYGVPNMTNQGRFQYTGQAWLPELGLYHYKARVYSPTLGRFLQVDPVGYDDQVNLYAYVGNDPLNHTDPDGLWTCGRNSDAQCGAVEAALRQARGALRNMRGPEAGRLRTALSAWGQRGVNNSVVVRAANIGSVAQTSTDNGITTVSVNSNITTFAQLERVSVGSAGGTVAHEGGHIHDERVVLGGRNPRTAQERYDTERRSYRIQGEVDRALGAASRGGYPLWSPSWGSSERSNMDQGARENAWMTACRSGCFWGINPW